MRGFGINLARMLCHKPLIPWIIFSVADEAITKKGLRPW
jgi:hypothetical protein